MSLKPKFKTILLTGLLACTIFSINSFFRHRLMTRPNVPKFSDARSVNLLNSKEDVLKILGEPSSKLQTERWVENWKYKEGNILFDGDQVCGWDSPNNKLNVKINDSNRGENNPTILMNSSVEQVLKLHGTPSSINLFGRRPNYNIKYGKVLLTFFNNKLVQYSNPNKTFDFKFNSQTTCKGNLKIDIGVAIDQIIACWGMPNEISIHDIDMYTWHYQEYILTIRNKKVVGFE